MDSSGHFYLSGDGTHGLAWDGTTLNISGSIAIQNPADVRTALNVAEGADVTSENTAADTELLNGLYTSTLFGTTVPEGEGLFIDGTHLGYHDGVSWKTYMDNGGNFYLSGSGTHGLAWDGETLSITGNVLVQNPSTVRAALNVADGADVTGANTALDTSLVNGTSASTIKTYAINGNTAKGYTDAWKYGSTTYINGGQIYTNTITANQIAANAITASHIDVTSLSSLTANLGTITSGTIKAVRAQNTANTNYINFDASGTNTFMKVGSNVDIKADGSGSFARTLVSAPNVIASGIKTGLNIDSSGTFWIDTGVTAPQTGWGVAQYDTYMARIGVKYTYDSSTPSPGYYKWWYVNAEVYYISGIAGSGAADTSGEGDIWINGTVGGVNQQYGCDHNIQQMWWVLVKI
jgi:hypothetical protein